MSQRYRKKGRFLQSKAPRSTFPFLGQRVKCALCEATHHFAPDEPPTDWRAIGVDEGHVQPICPAHFPPDGASAEAFEAAYLTVLRRLGLAQQIGPETDFELREYTP